MPKEVSVIRFAKRVFAGFLTLFLAVASMAQADSPPVAAGPDGLAVKGYDVVAYFEDGAATPGKSEFAYDWMGATWQFASAAHRDTFAANPEAYAPQFGGYCAYAVAKGSPKSADPNVWAIVEGKLYLNLSPSVQEKWEAERGQMIAAALSNWPGVLKDKKGAGGAASSDR